MSEGLDLSINPRVRVRMYVNHVCICTHVKQISHNTQWVAEIMLIIITYIVTYLVLLLFCLTISGRTKISWWQNLFTDVSIVFSMLSATVNERHEGTVYLILHIYKACIQGTYIYRIIGESLVIR